MTRTILPLMLLLAGAPAFAQNGTAPQPETQQAMHAQRFAELTSQLGLDPAAAERLKQTFADYRDRMQPLWQAQRQTRQAIKDELAAPQPDARKLTQLTDTLAANRQKMQALESQKAAELKRQLTPQQYAQLVVSHHAHGRGGFHKHMRNQ